MNTLLMAPCKDCKKRQVGCHGSCEDYLRYRVERRKLTNLERRMRGNAT